MPQYLVAIYRPDDYDPSLESEATIEKIHALNRELISAALLPAPPIRHAEKNNARR